MIFIVWTVFIVMSSVAINAGKTQEEPVFPKIGDEKTVALELDRKARDSRLELPETSESFQVQDEDRQGKEHGCQVSKSYKCKGKDCEKEYKSKCFEKGE